MRQASIAYAGNDTGLAKKQYEAAARQFFEATIATVRAMRPGSIRARQTLTRTSCNARQTQNAQICV